MKTFREILRMVVRSESTAVLLFALLILRVGSISAYCGDSLYGKVIAVKSGNEITLDAGTGKYELRLIGIDVPKEGPVATNAVRFVSDLILQKNARMRFEGRTPNGEMMARLYTDDPAIGIKEVGVELLKAGLARRQKDFDFKYGELAAAEKEAKKAKRGVWAPGNKP
jgi:endonuclease YncB( thermonuclease family)